MFPPQTFTNEHSSSNLYIHIIKYNISIKRWKCTRKRCKMKQNLRKSKIYFRNFRESKECAGEIANNHAARVASIIIL